MVNGSDDNRNFRVLLGQGVLGNTGFQLNSEKLVLPFLYTALGAPILFAGLIEPIVRGTRLASQILVAPVVRATARNKWHIAAALIVAALALAVICLAAGNVAVTLLVAIFLLAATVLGVCTGLSSRAFQDMLGRVLPGQGRSRLLFAQSGLGGVVAVLIALTSQQLIASQTALKAHTELMWAGIVMILLSAIIVSTVREPKKTSVGNAAGPAAAAAHGGVIWGLRDSFATVLGLPWFRRFLVARTLFLSVELATPFYAVHAATLHTSEFAGLSTFVIASSVGLVLGGIVWPRVGKGSIKVVLAAAACVTSLAGILALAIELRLAPQTSLVHAGVFVIVAFGAQGVLNGRTVYLVGVTTDDERPHCIAVANVITGCVAVALGAALGTVAQIKGAVWPLVIIIGLNIVAALYTIKLSDGRPRASNPRDKSDSAHPSAVEDQPSGD